MSWNLYAPAGSGKTTLAKKLLVCDIRDRLLLNAVFGDDSIANCSRVNTQSSNSRYIDLKEISVVYLTKKDFIPIKTVGDISKIGAEDVITDIQVISSSTFEKLHALGSFLTKVDQGYVDARLTCGVSNPESVEDLYMLIEQETYQVVAHLQILDDTTLWIAESSFSIDTLLQHPKLFGFGYVQTEGMSAVPLEYVYATTKSQTGSNIDFQEQLLKLTDGMEEDAVNYFLEVFQNIGNGVITKRSEIIDLFSRIAVDDGDDGEVKKAITELEKLMYKYREYIATTLKTIDPKNVVTDKRVVSGISYKTGKPLIVNKPIMSFQLSIEGFMSLDSLLNYIFSPGSSYLEKGVSSDIITSLAKTTFSTLLLLYAPLGPNDPMSYYDVEAVQSGDICTSKKGEYLDLPLLVTHRETGREQIHVLADYVTYKGNDSVAVVIGGFKDESHVTVVIKTRSNELVCCLNGQRKDFIKKNDFDGAEFFSFDGITGPQVGGLYERI